MDDLVLYDLEMPLADTIKNLIGDQGPTVCRDKISKSWIKKAVDEAEFGYVRFTRAAQMGRRSLKRKADRYTLYGFVLCRPEQTEFPHQPQTSLLMDLVCSRPQSQTGALLIECAEQEAIRRGYEWMKIFCLPDQRLRAYYEAIGYFKTADVPDYNIGSSSSSGVKAYAMSKDLLRNRA